MSDIRRGRILSIQSFVLSGYVGNCAAVFPLQLLGYDVDVIPSCILSNHTGYKNGTAGLRFSGDDLTKLVNGLRENHLLDQVTHILTGYIGNPSFLTVIAETVRNLRQTYSDDIIFVCDPVLGDHGKLYVPAEQIQIYKDNVLHLASIITPNAFELGLLTNINITTESDAFEACERLHSQYGIPKVFVTGTQLRHQSNILSILASIRHNGKVTRFAVDADALSCTFTGSGDLLSALLLAWLHRLPDHPQDACVHAMASVTAVLIRTKSLPKSHGDCSMPELRLVQSQQDILHPPLHLVRLRAIYE